MHAPWAGGTPAPPEPRGQRLRELLLEITPIPTAAGREHGVIASIERWVRECEGLALTRDGAGNLVVSMRGGEEKQRQGREPGLAPGPRQGEAPPLFITAHLDHPAFVVERLVAPGVLEMSFRGGVNEVYFADAPVTLHAQGGATIDGVLTGKAPASSPAGQHYLAEFDGGGARQARVGDIATWRLPPARIDEAGVLHTPACDDLAAVACAMAAMEDFLREPPEADVRLLFTRAEEIGFVGAIAAVKQKTMPAGSRVIALENSRAFADSPVGGGPIVRVGDRISVFTPWLTQACAERAEKVFGGPATAASSQAAGAAAPRRWQRKLMAGGACEASVFCVGGYEATCLCLPLGNYHNMGRLDEVQAGTYDAKAHGPARCAPEFIHTEDAMGLVDLLVALGQELPGPAALSRRFDKLWDEKRYVLGE